MLWFDGRKGVRPVKNYDSTIRKVHFGGVPTQQAVTPVQKMTKRKPKVAVIALSNFSNRALEN